MLGKIFNRFAPFLPLNSIRNSAYKPEGWDPIYKLETEKKPEFDCANLTQDMKLLSKLIATGHKVKAGPFINENATYLSLDMPENIVPLYQMRRGVLDNIGGESLLKTLRSASTTKETLSVINGLLADYSANKEMLPITEKGFLRLLEGVHRSLEVSTKSNTLKGQFDIPVLLKVEHAMKVFSKDLVNNGIER